LLDDLSPEAVEKKVPASMFGSKKAQSWDTFVTIWRAKEAAHENGMLDVFLAYFSEAYAKGSEASSAIRDSHHEFPNGSRSYWQRNRCHDCRRQRLDGELAMGSTDRPSGCRRQDLDRHRREWTRLAIAARHRKSWRGVASLSTAR
jgi:hypothetical protein